jgi:hypothetical protein
MTMHRRIRSFVGSIIAALTLVALSAGPALAGPVEDLLAKMR